MTCKKVARTNDMSKPSFILACHGPDVLISVRRGVGSWVPGASGGRQRGT